MALRTQNLEPPAGLCSAQFHFPKAFFFFFFVSLSILLLLSFELMSKLLKVPRTWTLFSRAHKSSKSDGGGGGNR